jgi:hypothetical protein
MQPGNVVSR